MKFETQQRFEKPLVPLVPVTIEVNANSGRYQALEWVGEIDTGSFASAMPAELLPDPARFDELPEWPGLLGYPHDAKIGLATFRILTCRILFGGVPFNDHLLVWEPRSIGTKPRWLPLLGSDFLSTFTVAFEYHKTPPVFHVKHPHGQLESVDTLAERFRQIDGVGPQWRPGEGPWQGPDYVVSAEAVPTS